MLKKKGFLLAETLLSLQIYFVILSLFITIFNIYFQTHKNIDRNLNDILLKEEDIILTDDNLNNLTMVLQ